MTIYLPVVQQKIRHRDGDSMGLFDFLKKNRSGSFSSPRDASNSEKQINVFKGDLAFLQNAEVAEKKETSHVDNTHTGYASDNEDSADSVVFMTFAPITRNNWSCPECGTSNEESLNGCIVCGLRKIGG